MFALRHPTDDAWLQTVLADVDTFLQDHAHNERKVSGSALLLAAHHPDRVELVAAMIDLAQEELRHFKQVHDLLAARGKTIGQDRPDPYMGPLRKAIRKRDHHAYLLDRLVLFAIVEARGCERFDLMAEHLPDERLRSFYRGLVACERRHHRLFLDLAERYYRPEEVQPRLDELLELEASVVSSLPPRAALH
jgi:tRNA-(ms[2]io[6]A)-hydroxylase